MTFINFIPDDLGVQRLKSENAQPGTARAVTPVEPYPTQQPGQPHPQPLVLRRQEQDQRKQERRRGERRKKQVPVILDTRLPQNQRRTSDRRDDQPKAASLNLFV